MDSFQTAFSDSRLPLVTGGLALGAAAGCSAAGTSGSENLAPLLFVLAMLAGIAKSGTA